jgi:hypothetical protein
MTVKEILLIVWTLAAVTVAVLAIHGHLLSVLQECFA